MAGEAAAAAAAAAVGAGAGAAAAACHGEAAPSARRKRFAITLTEAGASCRDLTRFGPGQRSCLRRFPGDAHVLRAKSNRPVANLSSGELDDGALAENTPCAGVRSCGKVRVLTS